MSFITRMEDKPRNIFTTFNTAWYLHLFQITTKVTKKAWFIGQKLKTA